MKRLNVTVPCLAWYESSIAIPDDMTLEEGVSYARKHIEDIPVTKLHWLDNTGNIEDEDSYISDISPEAVWRYNDDTKVYSCEIVNPTAKMQHHYIFLKMESEKEGRFQMKYVYDGEIVMHNEFCHMTLEQAKTRALEEVSTFFEKKADKYSAMRDEIAVMLKPCMQKKPESDAAKRKKEPEKNTSASVTTSKTAERNEEWCYETGTETPEILGSGSTYSDIYRTENEQDAINAFCSSTRNYLLRRTKDGKRLQVYNSAAREWKEECRWRRS